MEPAAQVSADLPDQADLARTFADYGKAARGTAIKNHTKGDTFGETLANSRAEVYDKAAELVRQLPLPDAAHEMMDRAKAGPLRTPSAPRPGPGSSAPGRSIRRCPRSPRSGNDPGRPAAPHRAQAGPLVV